MPSMAVGLNGGLNHIFSGIAKALEVMDLESLLYGSKLMVNLSVSSELIFVVGESGYIDYLCRIITCLKDGPKHGQTD